MKHSNKTKKMIKKNKKRQTKKRYGGTSNGTVTKAELAESRKSNKRQTKKKYGGKSSDTVTKSELAELVDNKRTDDIMEKIKADHTINISDLELPDILSTTPDLGDSSIIQTTNQIAEGVTVNAIDNAGALLGVDLTNPQETSDKLDDIKEAIASPENVEKMTEIIGEAAEVGAVALKAVEPFTDPLIEKAGDVLEKSGSEVGKAGISILLNLAETIPLVGIPIGIARSVSNAAEAGLAVVDATSEVATVSADTVNAATQNFEELLQEKSDVLKRTEDSVKDFEESVIKTVPSIDKVPTGGFSRRNTKKYNGKTKRVRFAL